MSATTTRAQIAEHIADILMGAVLTCQRSGGGRPVWSAAAGLTDPTAAAAFDLEVQALLKGSRPLRAALGKACEIGPPDAVNPAVRAQVVELLAREFGTAPNHARRSLETLLGLNGLPSQQPPPPFRVVTPGGPRATLKAREAASRKSKARSSVKRVRVPVLLLNLIIVSAMAFGPLTHFTWGTRLPVGDPLTIAVSCFAVWALSFIPGWLLVRFLERRAGALWDEYVIHLHRLGVDLPGNLPEPPKTSVYYATWRDQGGLSRRGLRNLYQEKFDAYYGKSVSRFGTDRDAPVKSEALFPVFLCTAVLAVGWTTTLYDSGSALTKPPGQTTGDILPFAFMGAYLYFVQMLMRRYFQTDLRAGAYVSGFVRIIGALIITAVLQKTLLGRSPVEVTTAVAFTVGWFPDVGLRWLLRVGSRRLRGAVPSVEPDYALNRLDGLNVWYESRLLEEGIEDLQNLATAKLVDVVLHTRVPVARVVDWVDQALLLIHLPAEHDSPKQRGWTASRTQTETDRSPMHRRLVLRNCGIRDASTFIRALGPGRDDQERERLLELLQSQDIPRASVETLYRVLSTDTRITPVVNWQQGERTSGLSLG